MSSVLPERYLDLFEKQAFAHLETSMEDGRPQVTSAYRGPSEVRVIYWIEPRKTTSMG